MRDKDKLLTVEQWGSYGWSSMRYAFWDCTNLEINANDAPDLSYVTDMRYMFTDISSINSNISGWDVSHVRQFDYLFLGLSSFNQPLNNWDMSNATSIDGMFWDASSFNQPLDNWTFPNVTSTYSMFLGASSFNQDISGWDVSNLTVTYGMFQYADAFNQDLSSWDVSNVTNMSWMFDGTKNFNQPLDAWETSSLTNTRGMFYRAEAFNQPLGAWDVSNLTQAAEMFGNQYWSSTNLSYKNYDLTIKGWAAQPLQSYGRIDTGYVLGYCTAVAERAYMISTYNWTFNDGGSVCPSLSTTGSRVFTESSSDDGSIENTVTIISEVNSDFSDATFVEGTHYTATNIPAGLSLSVSRVDSGSLTVSLIGNATYHEDSDDVPGIAITFLDPAFVDIPASFIQNNPLSGFSIDFIQPTSPPTNISLSNSSIDENITPPGDVGTLTTEDPDSGDTFSYTLDCDSSAPDDSSFFIDTDQLKLNLSADYETKNSYDICIRSTDQTGKSYQKNFTIDINDLDESQPTPQTDFSLSISLLQTGEIKAGDTVTYKYTVKNEGPNDAELIGGLYIITPPEFTVGTIDKPVQSPDPIGPMPVSSVGLSVISSSYPGYNFVIFESESDPSHTVFTSGVSETFTITGNANTDFTNNQTTTRAIYGNADYEDTEAIALNTAIQNNQDFFLLPGNNVAHHTYTHGLSNPPTNPTNPFVNFTPKPASTGHPLASTGGIVASLSFISGTLLMIGALFIYAKRGIE